MGAVLTLAKTLAPLLIAAGIGYYLYTGAKAYRMELRDFRPTSYDAAEASGAALSALLDVATPVEWRLADGDLQKAYFRPGPSGTAVVMLHGSPGNAAGFHPWVAALARRELSVLVIDLPGYGASEGERSWADHYDESVILGLDFLDSQPGADSGRVFLFGYSQGGNIAARVAARDSRVEGVISMASYTNLRDQLRHQFRWRVPGIGLFAIAAAKASGVNFALMDSLPPLSQVSHKPLLVISGDNDHAIPVEMADALAATSSRSELWIIEGGNHINLPEVAGDVLYERIANFMLEKSRHNQKDSDEY